MDRALLIVNFGGPRDLHEIEAFLCELLTDRELIRTKLPKWLSRYLFTRIAKKRTKKAEEDYALIGGKSPIYETTEELAQFFKAQRPVLTFHRYLPSTHKMALRAIEEAMTEIDVLPLFPQFSYATTGSIAAVFAQRLSPQALTKLHWIKSYSTHPAFVSFWQNKIRSFLHVHKIEERDAVLLFSAHGLPLSFIDGGDPYEFECRKSFQAIMKGFAHAQGVLSYQSKFGRGEWLRPYTGELCDRVKQWAHKHNAVVFIPIAFSSDHIETLFEIEYLYLPKIAEAGLRAFRCPAPNLDPAWIEALQTILQQQPYCAIDSLCRGITKFAK